MQIEFLGTGGAITTPRPLCSCRVCKEARLKGIPYSRSGPSLFVHGPDLLFDTPEEIKDQLNRSRIDHIRGCFYSHWHPDHVMGRRVWELSKDYRSWPPKDRAPTTIYLPAQVAADFRVRLGSWDHLQFLEKQGLVEVVELRDGDVIRSGDAKVRPFRLAEDYVYAFLVETQTKRILIAMDELNDWDPPPWVLGIDLAVLPMGVVEFDVFTGERRIAAEHPVLQGEATFRETLEMARRLEAGQVILSHIEEPDGLGYDDLLLVEQTLRRDGLNVRFAFDTLVVDV